MMNRKPEWLLLDSWDIRVREACDWGFSGCETFGNRDLSELPHCPNCNRRVWARSIVGADGIKFTARRIGDITYESPETLVVTRRFRDAWAENGLNGITFSDAEVKCRFLARSSRPSEPFFFAYPRPVFTDFAGHEDLERVGTQQCSFCAATEVHKAYAPHFTSVIPGRLDCFLPSCMPGWVVVSIRACEVIATTKLLNLSVMRGFSWTEQRELERIDYSLQLPDGTYQSHKRFLPSLFAS